MILNKFEHKVNLLENGLSLTGLEVAAISGGVSALGGLAGNLMAGQQASAMAGANKLQGLSVLASALNRPEALQDVNFAQYASPDEYALAGMISPEAMSPTELRNILLNAEARQAQMDALGQYRDLSNEGLSAIDRAALTEIQNQVANQERASRESVLQNMAQRGMSGSGQELASSLQSQQAGSQNANLMGQQVAAQAQQARLQALGNMANLGSGIERADYEREANKATAQDAINQFNVQNRNVAQAGNIGAKQNIMNMNVSERNRINQANIDMQNQEQFQNKVGNKIAQYGANQAYSSGLSGSLAGMGQSQAGQAQSQYQTQAGMFGTGLQTGGTLAGAMYKQ